MKDGFVKVAAASPEIKVADVEYNAQRIIECMKKAGELGVKVLVFPELSLTGCTCGDLFSHRVLLDGAKAALDKIIMASATSDMLTLVGLPWSEDSRVYSVAAAISGGELLGLVPGTNSHRAFARPADFVPTNDDSIAAGTSMVFRCGGMEGLRIGVEVGEDIFSLCPPSLTQARAGATLIVQLAGFYATTHSTEDALLDLCTRSKRLACGMVMAAPGKGESSTDRVYSGLRLITENGQVMESAEWSDELAVSEIDIQHMNFIRQHRADFTGNDGKVWNIYWDCESCETSLTREYTRLPDLPSVADEVPAYCRRVINMQVSALAKRMEQSGLDHCVVGISGGVDSTLAVMISAMAVERLGLPSTNVIACTMPCFGTSSRTKNNAIVVAEQMGAEVRVIDISAAVNQHFDDIGHARDDYSVAFENAQARERTQVLLDIANKVNGLDVGTEDLSEYIDGWCTYNGDHTSNYDVNIGLTKTQVRANVRHIAQTTEDQVLAAALWDVLDCPVSPELLPIFDDQISQKSEDAVGSYSLQDFFTYHMLRCGNTPSKVWRLAKRAYGEEFTDEELIRWLRSYGKRLFTQQFKRSCLMDGPSVDEFSVSPRVGFLMPSDGEAALWQADIDRLEERLKK